MKKLICSLLCVVMTALVICPAAMADGMVFGDVNSDGNINSADALLVLQVSTGVMTLDENALAVSDVTGEGLVNAADALSILQYSSGLIDKFLVQNKEEEKIPSTTQEILDCYKQIAADNSEITTAQSFALVEAELVGKPLLSGALKALGKVLIDANSVDVNGFPGDVNKITVDDIESATYVENNDGTKTITLKAKSQTDDINGSKYEGPVGRTIGVVGDIPQVLVDTGADDFVNIDNTTAELVYDDAVVTVTVDENNKLVKGECSWIYTVKGDIDHVDINYGAVNFKDGSINAEVDYILAY